ncbi:MAG: condensation domain-containing protein, partial [Thermoanaerobaculia bacterium]
MSQGSQEGFRLSPQQRRAWLLAQEGIGSIGRWCALSIEGPLDLGKLRDAASRIASAHEILRTTFQRRPGIRVPFQVVSETAAPAWRTVELPAAARGDAFAAVAELVRQEEESPFDLERGPVFRLAVGTLSDTRHVLLLGGTSLAVDRRSLHSIATAIAEAYAGRALAEPDGVSVQYADFAQWQNELLETDDDAARAAREHGSRMSSAAACTPFGGLAGAVSPGPASRLLEPALLGKIDRFCADEKVTRPDFFLACWQTLLARTTGETEIVTEELHPGRKLEDLRNAIGPFAKALPVLGRFDGSVPFAEAVKNVAQARRQNDEWEEYFGRPEDLEASLSARTRRTGFEYAERPEPVFGAVTFSIVREFAPPDGWPIWFECVREGDGVRMTCGAEASPAAQAAAGRLANHLEILIRAAAESGGTPAGELPILGDEERRMLLVEWNRTS